jgi:hypothetical protein
MIPRCEERKCIQACDLFVESPLSTRCDLLLFVTLQSCTAYLRFWCVLVTPCTSATPAELSLYSIRWHDRS